MDRKQKPTRTQKELEEYNEEELVARISSFIDDEYSARSWKKVLSKQLGSELPADRSELQTHLQSATKEKLIEYTISLQTSLELRMSKQKRKRRSPRCVRHSEVQPSTPSEWYQARERRSTAQNFGSTEEALSRAKREHTERGGKITKVRRHLMETEQTVTSQTSELATLRRRLHERDQAAEQELHNYRQQLSVTNQNLVQAQRAAESTMEELLCTKATKEQMEKEFTEVYRQMREQATTYSSTEEELAEARRTMIEQKGEVSSLQKQLRESEAHARELLSTSRAESKQVKLALDTVTQQLQCNTPRQADFEAEHSDSGQDKLQKREADGAKRQMVEVPTVAATEVASTQLGEELGECLDGRHIWNQPEQREPRANAINDVQMIFGQDPGAPEMGNDCFHNYQPVDQRGMQGPSNAADNVIRVMTGMTYHPRCCQQVPEATTNQGCILCAKHFEEFTWFTVSEMGTDWLPGLTCPACGGPQCARARALTDSFVEF